MNEELHDILQEASAPDTAPQRLREIYKQHPQWRVQRALAGNPNTLLGLLLQLAKTCPREFAHNPALELYHLEDPKFLDSCSKETCGALLCVDDLPTWLWVIVSRITKIYSFYELPQARAKHVLAIGEVNVSRQTVISQAIEAIENDVKRDTNGILLALRHRFIGEPLLKPIMQRALFHNESRWRAAAARNAHAAWDEYSLLRRAGCSADLARFTEPVLSLTGDELQMLAQHGPWGQRLAARHPNTPPSELLSRMKAESLHEDVAANPSATAQLLAVAAQSDAEKTRRNIAHHPNTAPETLQKLLQDERRSVRRAVALSPRLSGVLMKQLAADSDSFVRSSLARNRALNAALLTQLAGDENPWVRANVARHPNTSQNALKYLANDAEPMVQSALRHREDALKNLSNPYPKRERSLPPVSKNPPSPWRRKEEFEAESRDKVLKDLAVSSSLAERAIALLYPQAPRELLEQNLYVYQWQLRVLLTCNPALPLDLLAELARDGHSLVRAAAKARINEVIENHS